LGLDLDGGLITEEEEEEEEEVGREITSEDADEIIIPTSTTSPVEKRENDIQKK